ncbi:MAG: dihydroorotate dehydrogenase-like protein [Leptospirales bacterium]|nr:dihydroorotate dehydrogenase-like protein [Leptospirales bacterium]
MVDLRSRYLGLELKNPLVASASPLSRSLDSVRRLEDAGVAALVMYSLFEEQINHEKHELDHFLSHGAESFAEALSYFPEPAEYANLDAEEYLEQLQQLKQSLSIPVIASLNGVSAGGWIKYAQRMQEAGADAIELNVFYIPADLDQKGADVEAMYIEDVAAVRSCVSIPVAIKLSPYFSAFGNMARRLVEAGASGLTLFNRFYQPDIDLDCLEVTPHLTLSTQFENRLPLQWIAILRGRVTASLAATSGVHDWQDTLKLLLVGADAVMMASALLRHGPARAAETLQGLQQWMEEREYESVEQLKGSMSYQHVAEPAAFERANYMRMLHSAWYLPESAG